MMRAGLSLVASLSTLEEQSSNPEFRAVLGGIKTAVEGGGTFSDGLNRYPTIFDDLYLSIVRAGERSGEFAETMRRIAMLLESSARLQRKVKSAMTYPVVVLCMALAIATGLITFVVPVFTKMFDDFGGKLPLPTRMLVGLSDWTRHNALIIIPVLALANHLFRRWKKTPAGALKMDALYLKTPVLGPLVTKVAMARFAHVFALMVRSGVPILDSLEIVSKACGNLVIGTAIMEARRVVEQGEPLSRGLDGKPCIPILVTRMMAAGERSGKLDEMLENIAVTYDDEVETTLSSLTSLLEPLLMVMLGLIIGSIVIAMFMPIFKMGSIINV